MKPKAWFYFHESLSLFLFHGNSGILILICLFWQANGWRGCVITGINTLSRLYRLGINSLISYMRWSTWELVNCYTIAFHNVLGLQSLGSLMTKSLGSKPRFINDKNMWRVKNSQEDLSLPIKRSLYLIQHNLTYLCFTFFPKEFEVIETSFKVLSLLSVYLIGAAFRIQDNRKLS